MPRLFDISVPVMNGGVVYPGNPEIQIEAQQDMAMALLGSILSQLTLSRWHDRQIGPGTEWEGSRAEGIVVTAAVQEII